MDNFLRLPKTEKPARIFLLSVSIVGWLYVGQQIFHVETWKDPWIFGLLLIFLAICEMYPMPVWKGFTTISFPIVFVLYFIYGLPLTLISYSLIIFIVNLIDRRPFRIVCFNPAQLAISFSISAYLSHLFTPLLLSNENILINHIGELFILTFFFYMINNLFVDLVLLLRPQRYPFQVWKQKTVSEFNSAVISFLYGCLFLILGSQNRGEIDVFSFFFFFSPLMGLALLSSVIVRLKIERNRLKALFSLTSRLNKMLPTNEWIESLKSSFHQLIDVDGIILWTTQDGNWKVSFKEGKVTPKLPLDVETLELFNKMKKPYTVHDSKKEKVPAGDSFDDDLRSFVFAPLVIESDTVGVIAVSRNRTKSFTYEEIQSIATLANQLAVIIKTRVLIIEKEKRILLEERNRIARDIHDGIAQTLAGALMKLETAQRKWEKSPDESLYLVSDSMDKLRVGLKQVRESIYALRPNPTENVGLHSAIKQKIKKLEQEFGISFNFELRGKVEVLSTMVEKILFETLQESIQNVVKHANASKVDVLLSYQKENIILKVKDNGIGFSLLDAMVKAQQESHFGILQMNDAAEKIGASLQIDSKPEKGTEMVLIIPKMGVEGGDEYDQAYVSR